MNPREMLSVGEAAAILRCCRRTVMRYARSGRLIAYRRGGNGPVFFSRAHVVALFSRERRGQVMTSTDKPGQRRA